MNKFFNYIQPTIIQATMNEELPERVRGRYFINFNVLGIEYFDEHYLLQETVFGAPYLILKESGDGAILLEDSPNRELIDIPRIYIDITDKFVNDEDGLFQSFVLQAMRNNKIWVRGIDRFFGGMDFYSNHTLYNYLALTDQVEVEDLKCRLPNYLDAYGNIQTQYWNNLEGEIFKDYKNLPYFNEKNKLIDNEYSEEELNNFYSNFCKIILEYTKIGESGRENDGLNPVYRLVLNYFKNFGTDCASESIAMILNTGYTVNTNAGTSGCGCNSNSSSNNGEITPPCSTLYEEAMRTWLVKMLGDTQFYQDWFMIYENDEDYIPNDVLGNRLYEFIEEFIGLGNTLSFLQSKYRRNCDCPTILIDENDCNYNILMNYLKVISYALEDVIIPNANKVKIYGEKFGELLPRLQF